MVDKQKFGSARVTAKNIRGAKKQAKSYVGSVFSGKYKITDVFYIKGSKKRNYEGKIMKRYGIVFRRKKNIKW